MTLNIFSTSATISIASNAQFQAFVAEIIAGLSSGGTTGVTLVQLPDTGQINPATVAVPGATTTSAGHALFRFNDTLGAGPLNTSIAELIVSGGTGYNGSVTHTFTAVPLTGGSGSGAQATVTCTSGVVTAIAITTAGTGYNVGDLLSASNTNLGGSGSGLSVYVTALASSASPVVFRLDFGTGASLTQPYLWCQVGTGSNGTGTLTAGGSGTITALNAITGGNVGSACSNAQIPGASVYPSRYMYNAGLGRCFLNFKVAAGGTTGQCITGFHIWRSCDSTGAATGDAVMLMTNNSAAVGNASQAPGIQCISFLNNLLYPSTAGGVNSSNLSQAIFPFAITSSLFGGNVQVGPCFEMTPVLHVSDHMGVCLNSEVGFSSQAPGLTLVGSTPKNYINLGSPCGGVGLSGMPQTTFGCLATWQ